MLTGAFRYVLIQVGKYCSPKVVHRLNATANYIALGNWLRDMGLEVPVVVSGRTDVFDLAGEALAHVPVLYLEFGVWKGDATRYWSSRLKHPQSLLHGFDSFEGLPESWNPGREKAHFSTDGNIPEIDDARVSFFKGWFEESLKRYEVPAHETLILNLDADLYSSTKTVLTFLREHIKPGTYIYFDEFNDRLHEMRAFDEFIRETGMTFKVVGANRIFSSVLFQRVV
jgi:Macrocin-O-methyltransferase (TylF)